MIRMISLNFDSISKTYEDISSAFLRESLHKKNARKDLCNDFTKECLQLFYHLYKKGYFENARLFGRMDLLWNSDQNEYSVDVELLAKSKDCPHIFQSSIEFSLPYRGEGFISRGAVEYIQNVLLSLKSRILTDFSSYKIYFQRDSCLSENEFTKTLPFCAMEDEDLFYDFIRAHKSDKIIVAQTLGGQRIESGGRFYCQVQYGIVIENGIIAGHTDCFPFKQIYDEVIF